MQFAECACGHRHRSFLQCVYAGVDRCPITLHWLLPKKRGRIQQRVQECQTRPHRGRHCLRMDLGRYSGPFVPPAPVRSIPTSDICRLLALHQSSNRAPWPINTVSPVHGGMAPARRFKFCFSPRSGPRFLIQRSVETNITMIPPAFCQA